MMLEFELMIKHEFVPWVRSIFCHHEFDCFVEETTYPKKGYMYKCNKCNQKRIFTHPLSCEGCKYYKNSVILGWSGCILNYSEKVICKTSDLSLFEERPK